MKLISPSRAEKRLVVTANIHLKVSDLSHVGLEHIGSSHDTVVLASSELTWFSDACKSLASLLCLRLPLACSLAASLICTGQLKDGRRDI